MSHHASGSPPSNRPSETGLLSGSVKMRSGNSISAMVFATFMALQMPSDIHQIPKIDFVLLRRVRSGMYWRSMPGISMHGMKMLGIRLPCLTPVE